MKTNIVFAIVLLLSITALIKNWNSFKLVPRETPTINFKNYYSYGNSNKR